MTRTQVQIPDVLFRRIRRYAESRETSVAEVFRNALELFINIHSVEGVPEKPKRWTVPVCRSTGLFADPFAEEDWRAQIYEDRDE
ncbi:MAG: antitoxin [Kiritimatiellae bacterium]|nr:antitoxin [Kiritimatiellia bacterium]